MPFHPKTPCGNQAAPERAAYSYRLLSDIKSIFYSSGAVDDALNAILYVPVDEDPYAKPVPGVTLI